MRLDGEWGEGDIFQKKELRGFVRREAPGAASGVGEEWGEEARLGGPCRLTSWGLQPPWFWLLPQGRSPGGCRRGPARGFLERVSS